MLPPQAVGNIPRQVVRSYAADTGTWKELCVAKKRHHNCLGPVLGWCLPLAEPDGLEARARGPVIYSLQVSLPGHRGGLESPSGGTTRPPSAILFSFTVSVLANYSKPSFNNMFHTLMWLSEIDKNEERQEIDWMAECRGRW